jgi:cytoskeletal protein RodZ
VTDRQNLRKWLVATLVKGKGRKTVKSHTAVIVVLILILAGIGLMFLSDKQTGSSTALAAQADSAANPSQLTSTAKPAYRTALAEAKRFARDSFLVDLDTTGVQKDGKSRTWYVLFYSPSRNTNLKVNVVGGRVQKTEALDKKKTVEIAGDWIDSDQAASIAQPKCGQVSEEDYFINLRVGKDGKTLTWNFHCNVGKHKTLIIDVNARTGEYIKTRKAGIGW